jgi:5-methylcytosine-specific restriction endonuclease McrA
MSDRLEFSHATKKKAYELRGGICAGLIEVKLICTRPIEVYDHIMRCEIKSDNSLANCRPLCSLCHTIKTTMDAKAAKKGRAIRRETKKSQKPKAKIRSAGFQTNRDGPMKQKMSGKVVRRG